MPRWRSTSRASPPTASRSRHLVVFWLEVGVEEPSSNPAHPSEQEQQRYVDGSPSLSKNARLRSVADLTSRSNDMTSM